MPQKTERAGKLFESKLRFWLRMALVVAYSLMLNSMLNNMQQMNTDAIAYMQNELEEDRKFKELK